MRFLSFFQNIFKPKPETFIMVHADLYIAAPWMSLATAELGQHEIAGTENNPRIVEYHSFTLGSAPDDETSWCAAFVNFIMIMWMIKSFPNWFGKQVSLHMPNSIKNRISQLTTLNPQGVVESPVPATLPMFDAWARSWLQFGATLNSGKYGCIVVLERGPKFGHVGFYVKETTTHVLLLAGNQSDKVCLDWYPKARVLGYRWPLI